MRRFPLRYVHVVRSLLTLTAACLATVAAAQDDPRDWPTYNHDLLGTRHNAGETAISAANAGQLEEKWRFPAAGSKDEIGTIHATPVVVDNCTYFGTATDPAFFKLGPDGQVLWTYKIPVPKSALDALDAFRSKEAIRARRFESAADGVMGSALVAGETVYFANLGGKVFALHRETGEERWILDTRSAPFPDAHDLNVFFASPILAEGKLIVAGGTLEQVVAAMPLYQASTGRGFVMALDPADGRVLWKYDVGPKPQKLDPPIVIEDSWGKHPFHYGPASSSLWCTPSFDAESGTIFIGTDVNTAPRRPTDDDPRLDTPDSCAVLALSIADGQRKWSTQIASGDVWTNAMRSYDPVSGKYKDQSIGDTPKIFSIPIEGRPTKVVGCGCKNGGFYVLRADDGRIVAQTPIYTGPPAYPLSPELDPRTLALPSAIGGLQTGCATDGVTIFTNGIDAVRLASQETPEESIVPPTGGRVTALSLDTAEERWRHNRPLVASIGGPAPAPVFENVGDPVASGIAVANGVVFFTTVVSGKLVALDAAGGDLLKEFDLGPVWSGPAVSRGRVYVGTGNTLFNPYDWEAYFPKRNTGVLHCFGLPGEGVADRSRP